MITYIYIYIYDYNITNSNNNDLTDTGRPPASRASRKCESLKHRKFTEGGLVKGGLAIIMIIMMLIITI